MDAKYHSTTKPGGKGSMMASPADPQNATVEVSAGEGAWRPPIHWQPDASWVVTQIQPPAAATTEHPTGRRRSATSETAQPSTLLGTRSGPAFPQRRFERLQLRDVQGCSDEQLCPRRSDRAMNAAKPPVAATTTRSRPPDRARRHNRSGVVRTS